MARGRDRFNQRKAAALGLGRVLSRRARNRCEFCRQSTSLAVIEIEPIADDPDPEWAVMLCERCASAVDGGRDAPGPADLRFLEEAVWAEHVPVQVCAVRLTRRLAKEGTTWAVDLLSGLYLDPEVEGLIE